MDPIASKWKQLASMDRQSPGFLPLILFLIAGANRPLTIRLRGNDAKITLGALDEVSLPSVAARNGQVLTPVVLSTRFLGTVKSRSDMNAIPSA